VVQLTALQSARPRHVGLVRSRELRGDVDAVEVDGEPRRRVPALARHLRPSGFLSHKILSRILSGTQRPVQTVSGVHSKRTCSRDTGASSASRVHFGAWCPPWLRQRIGTGRPSVRPSVTTAELPTSEDAGDDECCDSVRLRSATK